MFHRTATLIRAAAVAAMLTAAALGTPGLASAERSLTVNDQAFLDGLQAADIGFDSPAAAIEVAHMICEDMADGASYGDLLDEIVAATDLSFEQADTLADDSIWYYCPEFY
jgi:Protein of unknown function (DUF732)